MNEYQLLLEKKAKFTSEGKELEFKDEKRLIDFGNCICCTLSDSMKLCRINKDLCEFSFALPEREEQLRLLEQ